MPPPCAVCERELRPAALIAGDRCRRCLTALTDRALDALLAGLRLPRRRRWARLKEHR